MTPNPADIRIEELAAQLATARRENAAMREDIAVLCHMVQALGHVITVAEMARLQRVRNDCRKEPERSCSSLS